jgi:hypothetical protein
MDLTKIFLVNDKNTYRIRYGGVNKIILKVPEVYSPFGIEKYNNKEILNLEFDYNNNDKYNILAQIKSIDNYFLQFKERDEFKDLNYMSPIKELSGNKISLRCHVSNKLNFKTKNSLEVPVIKKNKFNIELEFTSIWKYNENYGLLITINTVDFT